MKEFHKKFGKWHIEGWVGFDRGEFGLGVRTHNRKHLHSIDCGLPFFDFHAEWWRN